MFCLVGYHTNGKRVIHAFYPPRRTPLALERVKTEFSGSRNPFTFSIEVVLDDAIPIVRGMYLT